jgi:hypothetical protein
MSDNREIEYKGHKLNLKEVTYIGARVRASLASGTTKVSALSPTEKEEMGVKFSPVDELKRAGKALALCPNYGSLLKQQHIDEIPTKKQALVSLRLCRIAEDFFTLCEKYGQSREQRLELFSPHGFKPRESQVMILHELGFTRIAELFEDRLEQQRMRAAHKQTPLPSHGLH